MTTDVEILAGLRQREGGWRDAVGRPDGSWDPATNKGITSLTFQIWRTLILRRPEPTLQDLRDLTDEEAAEIYRYLYIYKPGFTAENIRYEPLRVQLIDFGVNSGPERAIRWLQRVLGLPEASVDGVLGPNTRDRLRWILGDWTGMDDWQGRLLNDALVAARSYMIDRAVDQGTMRKADEEGVESRALSFLLSKP